MKLTALCPAVAAILCGQSNPVEAQSPPKPLPETKIVLRVSREFIHKLTGVLVHSVEGCAYQIRYLLTHPEFAEQLGKNGREHVKENFLMTTNVKRWLLLFQILLGLVREEKPPA